VKKYLVVVVTFLVVGELAAQQFSVGLKGGLNFPTVDALGLDDGIQLSDRQGASGYHIGAFTLFKFSKIGIQTELLYSFQSFDLTVQDVRGNNVGSLSQNISYLTVPVMLRLYLLPGLNVQIGPQFGFFLDKDQSGTGLVQQLRVDSAETMKGTDIGLNVGAGWDLPFGLDLHARYTIGLQDVSETDNAAKNSMVQISLGYAFFRPGK
jgi:hypothetical protein